MDESTIEAAFEIWPDMDVSPEEFSAYCKLCPEANDSYASDLLLAFACGQGNDRALELFEKSFSRTIALALSRLPQSGDLLEEVTQRLRTKLFVGTSHSGPKITSYSGKGPLRAWIKAAAIREALNTLKSNEREVSGLDEYIESVPDLDDSQELLHLKSLYRSHFKSAFQESFAQLSPRNRTLLRYKYGDGRSLDEVAKLYRVHRATVARWYQAIREELYAGTTERMELQLTTGGREVASILRLIRSRLDASIRDYLIE